MQTHTMIQGNKYFVLSILFNSGTKKKGALNLEEFILFLFRRTTTLVHERFDYFFNSHRPTNDI